MSEFSEKDGRYNKDYLLHIQELGRPQHRKTYGDIEPADEIFPINAGVKRQGLISEWANKVGIRNSLTDDAKLQAHNNLLALTSLLWTPGAMRGSEPRCGSFEASVVDKVLNKDMAFDKINIDVSTKVFPSVYELAVSRYHVGTVSTLQRNYQDRFDVELPREINATIGIVAPRESVEAARHMLMSHFSQASQELASFSGFTLRESIAQELLDQETREKYGMSSQDQIVGWFELYSGVFMTIDPQMFDNVIKAIDAEKIVPTRFRVEDRKPVGVTPIKLLQSHKIL